LIISDLKLMDLILIIECDIGVCEGSEGERASGGRDDASSYNWSDWSGEEEDLWSWSLG